MFGFRKRKRAALRATPLPPAWVALLENNVPYYANLSPADRTELHGLIQVFLAEKRFEGCGGLQITDEMRVTIAAQACVLLLHRDNDDYPLLRSILVYPHAYLARQAERLPGGIVLEGEQARLGEAWSSGSVILSWDDVVRGAADVHDGHNVVFHEFAHQLDNEAGAGDGAPRLPKRSMYLAWARVLGHDYEELVRSCARHKPDVLDAYGATNPAEFFAVASECFFEKPRQLRKRHPELYEQLRSFYRQDPAERAGEG